MPLTPEDVRTRQFGTTRFRPGYDQREVDAFLELVEEELVDRDLQLQQGMEEQTRWFDPSQEPPPGPGWQADPGPVNAPAAEGAVSAAARLLEMAEESAASTIAGARQEADEILNRARAEASTILTAARRQAAQLTSEAQALEAQVERSVQERRDDALRPLAEHRDELQRHITGLQVFARECRSRLRAYADQPLPGLDAEPADQQTARIGDVAPVSAGGIRPPSGNGNGNGSAPGAWTVPGPRQGSDPAVPSAPRPAPRLPPEETGSPAPGRIASRVTSAAPKAAGRREPVCRRHLPGGAAASAGAVRRWRMNIGETLAQARHRAGLSVAQVSEQTRIRPLILRSIEAGDYSLCGSDFYARQDIRSIAEVMGADPGPLIEMYDRARRAPGAVPSATPDGPPGPSGPTWHRQPAFMLAFGVAAIMLTIGSVGYRLMQKPPPGPGAAAVTADNRTSLHGYTGQPDAASAPGPAPARPPAPEQTLSRAHSMDPVSAVAFGPDGRGHGDDPQGAWLAIDGHRRTAWHTGRYATARFGTLDPGTGLLLDMGHPVKITAIRVTLGAPPGASFQIRVGDQPKVADLRAAASSAGPGGIVRITMARPATGRYVLVWFTRLPAGPGGTYQAAIHGIGVKARS